jgi:hypothetical protein
LNGGFEIPPLDQERDHLAEDFHLAPVLGSP